MSHSCKGKRESEEREASEAANWWTWCQWIWELLPTRALTDTCSLLTSWLSR